MKGHSFSDICFDPFRLSTEDKATNAPEIGSVADAAHLASAAGPKNVAPVDVDDFDAVTLTKAAKTMMEMLEEMSLSEGLISDVSFAGSQTEAGPSQRTPRRGPSAPSVRQTKVRLDLSPKILDPNPDAVPKPEAAKPVGPAFLKPEVGGASEQPDVGFLRTSHFNASRQLERSHNSSHRYRC